MIVGNTSSQGKKPDTPTIGTATAGNGQVTVSFTESSYKGKTAGGTYRATAGANSGTCSSPCSSITVTGLSNGTQYCFTVALETPYGVNSDSSSQACATPVAPPPPPPPPPVPPPPPPPVDPCAGVTCTGSCGNTSGYTYTGEVFVSGNPFGNCPPPGANYTCQGVVYDEYVKACCPGLACFKYCYECA